MKREFLTMILLAMNNDSFLNRIPRPILTSMPQHTAAKSRQDVTPRRTEPKTASQTQTERDPEAGEALVLSTGYVQGVQNPDHSAESVRTPTRSYKI
ncbi:hypothetical protein PIB30_058755 [Stylosanthes scabra]|uniref:Uncharacterized protein n=1 Tax=Stylosanthes scabra TaxID=79078 RepID=A0ABU6ZIS3_9FABA|nr:hypothetical protein [Stylosanthes scabra]